MLRKRLKRITEDELYTTSNNAESQRNDESCETDSNDKSAARPDASDTPRILKKVFAILMIVVYLGMGYLVFSGFFDPLFGDYDVPKYSLGLLFTLYGLWRAYRYTRS